MIKDVTIAKAVSDLMLDISGKLNQSIADVMSSCPDDEAFAYRRAVANVMAQILLDVLNPLYSAHPEIKPPELD